jgi:hypothetical protein
MAGFYPYTRNYPNPSSSQAKFLKDRRIGILCALGQKLQWQPTYPLHPIKTNNARALRITAAAGTKLAGTFFSNYRHLSRYV